MYKTLLALGWHATGAGALTLTLLIVGSTAALLAPTVLLTTVFHRLPVITHWCLWVVWLAWLALFPSRNASDRTRYGPHAFRRGFYRDVLFGVTCSFAQMIRPALHGLIDGTFDEPIAAKHQIGILLLVVGALLIGFAMEVLGVDGAIFLQEYTSAPALSRRGIYDFIRHPLFFGGIVASVGGAIAFTGQQSMAMALVNVAILPVYLVLEERRCHKVFGSDYDTYRATTGAFMPRISRVRMLLRAPELRALG